MKNKFQKTGFLIRFNFRKDWLSISIWIVLLGALMAAVAAKFEGIYGSKQSIASIASTLKTAGMQALFGYFKTPLKTSSDVFGTEMLVFMAIMMVIMNIYFAVKFTRAQEDDGLSELLAAHAIGKMANLTAATVELLVINLVIGILYSVGIQFSGMQGVDVGGAWVIGMGLAMVGVMFGAIAFLMAQVAASSRDATVLSYAIFGIMYVARMITDLKAPSKTWWVPLGWIEKIDAFHQNDWTPVYLMIITSLIIFGIALWINQNRDVGAGLIATRPGRAKASWSLRGPLSLMAHLNLTSALIWIIGTFILGTTYGSIFNTIGDILKTNPTMQEVFGKAAVHSANHQLLLSFISLIVIVMAALASVPAVQIMNRLHGDEVKGYLEAIHASRVSRFKVLISYLTTSIIVGLTTYFAGLMGLMVAGNLVLKKADQLKFEVLGHAFIAYAPVVILTIAIAVFLNSVLPKLNVLTWIYITYGFIAMYMGGMLHFPKWAKQLTGYGWANQVPVKSVSAVNSWTMMGIAVVLIVIGFIIYQRRDLEEK